MKLKIGLALVALSLIWPMVSEAGWRNRWVCHTGTATGGGSSSTTTVCGWEPYWEHEGVPEDPGFGGVGGPGGNAGWTPTYNDFYQDAHSCNMSDQERKEMAASAVRADVIQEQDERGQVGARRLEIRGYGGLREQFDIVPGNWGNFQLVYGFGFVQLVPGSCHSGSTGG
jgi:hypothetical protein